MSDGRSVLLWGDGTTWEPGPVRSMVDRTETAATYARPGGEPLDDLAWYEALAGYRFGIILARMSLRSLAYANREPPPDPDDLIMFAPLLEQLLQEAGA
jgi:aminoglycoside phosphotransferase (APT) family kinase protein